jgi:hypothetical protein
LGSIQATDKKHAAFRSDRAANGLSEASRAAAAIALLDRCYGRPAQALEHSSGIIVIPMDEIDMMADQWTERARRTA